MKKVTKVGMEIKAFEPSPDYDIINVYEKNDILAGIMFSLAMVAILGVFALILS